MFDVIYLVDEFSHELYLLAESNMQHVSAILRSLAAMLGIAVLLYDSNLSEVLAVRADGTFDFLILWYTEKFVIDLMITRWPGVVASKQT